MSCLELISVYYVHYRSIKVSYVSIGIESRKVYIGYIGIELDWGEVPNPSISSSHIWLHKLCPHRLGKQAYHFYVSLPAGFGAWKGGNYQRYCTLQGTNISHLGKIEHHLQKCLEKGNMLYNSQEGIHI